MVLTPQAFIAKWQNSPIKERAGAQPHFLDLCRLLGEPEPADVDPTGKDYGFEVGANKTTGTPGFADVFRRGYFAWEYKGTGADLDAAFAQLQRYAVALDNPPLLIVSDIGTTIRVHTNWTNSVSKRYEIAIADLADPIKRGWLKSALSDPEALRPSKTRQQLTEEVAGEFAVLARALRDRGHKPEEVAHFINRLVFCMFAEDVKLLPEGMFTKMLERALENPSEFETFARSLFSAMTSGGYVGFDKVKWFNGGLFDGDLVFPLTKDEIKIVHKAASQFWGDVDPSILGTLFERGLDPDKRSQLGAHYTDREKIMMIIDPVMVEPLSAEWDAAKAEIGGMMHKAAGAKGSAGTRAQNQAQVVLDRYLQRLAAYRVLDPACGSGNFLYLALKALKDLEHRAQVEAEALGLPRRFPQIGPEVVRGIEINPYAAELARVSVWIGEIQWMLRNGFSATENPVLRPLANIECRDALTTWKPATVASEGHWREAEWPVADAIIGNPPFLGGKLLRTQMGDELVDRLFALYAGRVPAEADLVVYWLEKGMQALTAGKSQRVGFVTTNSVRAGANRRVMHKIAEGAGIVAAWADEPWTVEGAAVRVSLVVYGTRHSGEVVRLDGLPVQQINSDLKSSAEDLTKSVKLPENLGIAFQGPVKVGAFDIDGATARRWLTTGFNPHGKSNSEVLRPWANGRDVVRRPSGKWIIDFGELTEAEASLYEDPFRYVLEHVRPKRVSNRDAQRRENWWRLGRSGGDFKKAAEGLARVLITPRVSKHRLFVWAPSRLLPDSRLVAIARDDDPSFGLIHSRNHELWSLRLGGWHGVGNDPQYTPSVGFETFPFPAGLSPSLPASDYAADPRAVAIGDAAKYLNELRENWLNPAELVRREPEVVLGYPDLLLPVDDAAADILRTRTLTNLYNQRPAWLDHAHKALDAAVAAAYGWPADLSDDDVLARLFALNQERAALPQ